MSDASSSPVRSLAPRLAIPLSGAPLNRADNLRGDAEALTALKTRPDAKLLALWSGKPLIDLTPDAPTPARLGWRPMRPATDETIFLGFDGAAPCFAETVTALAEDEAAALALVGSAEATRFIDLRTIAKDLASAEAAIVAEAKSLTDWRSAHRFCAKCGAPTAMAQGGWRADCAECGAKHFPRTDPVVIMLMTRRGPDGLDRVVLGRQAVWPQGMYSLLAGYVEPGETIEEAARREAEEESGVACGEVVYLASQPWPFPSTLMLGVWTEALSDDLQPDLDELEDCRWATRAEMRTVLAGDGARLGRGDWFAPRVDAIARVLIEAWVEGRLDGVAGPERG